VDSLLIRSLYSPNQGEVVDMVKKLAPLAIIGFIAFCSGCTIPCHPYDYCGPVHDGSGQYCSNVRAGSILNGDTQAIPASVDQEVIEEPISQAQPQRPMVQEYEGARQLLSVTDRKVEESESMANAPSEIQESSPVMAQPTSSNLRWR
jgi:hypothetical protein